VRGFAVLVVIVCVAGCASYNVRSVDFRNALSAGQPENALRQLATQYHSSRDRALLELNKAVLLHMTGDFKGSNDLFEQAKKRMRELSVTSITENITAVTVNEATRSYDGRPYEELLVYCYKALNYLLMGKPDSARVEVLQADVKMREWSSAEDMLGVKASAFTQYLSGIVFEMSREWDDALIAYRNAYKVYEETGSAIPVQLQQDLLRLTEFRGLRDEHKRYRKRFAQTSWRPMAEWQKQSELIVLVQQGLVSAMQEHIAFNYSPELKYQVQIATPFYSPRDGYVPTANVHIDGQVFQAEVFEDIDKLARTDLDARLPGISLRTLTRVVLKKKMANEMRKDNALAGFVADIAGLVSERADTRSWNGLPETLQIVRVPVAPGEHQITVSGAGGVNWTQTLNFTAGSTAIVSVHDMTGRAGYALH
jgi:hypothetical protein